MKIALPLLLLLAACGDQSNGELRLLDHLLRQDVETMPDGSRCYLFSHPGPLLLLAAGRSAIVRVDQRPRRLQLAGEAKGRATFRADQIRIDILAVASGARPPNDRPVEARVQIGPTQSETISGTWRCSE